MFMFFDFLIGLDNKSLNTIWVDNSGNPMRDNLGNALYFNTNPGV